MDSPKQSLDAEQSLNAEKIVSQVAALAAHLQLSGVQFLPQPRPENVVAYASRFQVSSAAEPESVSVLRKSSSTVSEIVKSETAPSPVAPPSVRPAKRTDPVSSFVAADGNYPGESLPIEQRRSGLEALRLEVASCVACPILSSCRNQTVFGEGSESPRFVFFGEGPGADEDRTGRPFVGKAGQLLTKMIEACKFRREDAYILNTVKCRPPGNRNPEPEEIDNCRHYYQRQLEILRPEYIVCLGAISSQELLKSKLPVGRLRGKLHSYFDSKVLVTYHPAYLLRNPDAKKAAWADLQLMLADAGIQL